MPVEQHTRTGAAVRPPRGSRAAAPALRRRRLGLVVGAVSWAVTAAAAAVVLAAVVVPRLSGAEPLTVLSGSMAPAYPAGTLVVVRPVPIEDVAIGDVVTYQLRSGEPTLVTHRVVGVGWDSSGEKVLTTRGDANGVADPAPVRAVQLRGEVWYSLPHVGRAGLLLAPERRDLLVHLVAAGCFVYAAGVVLRGRRRRPRAPVGGS